MKSAQVRNFVWSVFSRIWTEYGEIRSTPPEKYGPEKTPYLHTFHAVLGFMIYNETDSSPAYLHDNVTDSN